jgi:hypothetical protein
MLYLQLKRRAVSVTEHVAECFLLLNKLLNVI